MSSSPRYTLTTPQGVSGLMSAASLAQTILQLAQVRRWSDLDGQLPDSVVLDDDQFRTLVKYQTEISFLRATAKKTKDSPGAPGVSMAVCPECGKWLMITSGDVPKKCNLTNACPGTPQKAPPATRTEISDPATASAPSLFDDDPEPAPELTLEPELAPPDPNPSGDTEDDYEVVVAACFGAGDF